MTWFVSACLAALLAFLARKARALSVSGAIAAAIVGTFVLGGGGRGAVALLLFFISSSVLSRVGKAKKAALAFEKGGERDAGQVLANGGVAALCAGLLPFVPIEMRHILWVAMLGSLAEACADTWATEIGTLAARPPRFITNFRLAPPGASGAVSLPGTLAAVLGAFFIATVAYWSGDLGAFRAAWAGGVAGALFDSLLGATIQAQYDCSVCGKITERLEHCGKTTCLACGFPWMNNDVVNALGTLAGAIIAAVIFYYGRFR